MDQKEPEYPRDPQEATRAPAPEAQRVVDAAVDKVVQSAMAHVRPDIGLPEWTAFERVPIPSISEQNRRAIEAGDELIREAEAYMGECLWFENSRYVVAVHDAPATARSPAMWHLIIHRLDKQRAGPERYTDFMRIRDELIGDENAGAELYPARDREVDQVHAYHLWVFQSDREEFPWGFRYQPDGLIGVVSAGRTV